MDNQQGQEMPMDIDNWICDEANKMYPYNMALVTDLDNVEYAKNEAFGNGAEAMYLHLKSHTVEGDGWNEILTKGLPAIDEFVLWRTESGNYFVREIDKDDYDWWNGENHSDSAKCTHWKRIVGPCESHPSTDQDKGMKEEADEYRAMLIKILESGELYIGDQEEIARLIRKYPKTIR